MPNVNDLCQQRVDFCVSATFIEIKFTLIGVDIVQVTKNAILCKSVDELLQKGRDEVKPEALSEIVQKVRSVTDSFIIK